MNKIPTAEEFLIRNGCQRMDCEDKCDFFEDVQPKDLIEFAKLHVESALKNAYDCHRFKGWTNSDDESVHKELFVKNIMSRQSII